MVRYVPLLANGQRVKLSWPLKLFRLNHIFWPLDKSTSTKWRYFDYSLALMGWIILLLHNDAQLRYLRSQTDVNDFMSGMPTYLIIVESQIRSLHILWHREQLREVLEKFFSSIYVDPNKEPKIFLQIELKLRLNRFVSGLYLAAVSGYVLLPIVMLVKGSKDLLLPMILPFNVEPLHIFVPLTLSSVWVALQTDSMSFGETALLCELMGHLKARHQLIQRDLDESIEQILRARQRPQMAQQMREVLVQSILRNLELNQFSEQLEEHFTVQVFTMFGFSAILLCALGFMTYASPSDTYMYPIWFGAKTVEFISIGQFGTDLAYMTNNLSTMYYQSQWEQSLYYSTNSLENLRLMKVVLLAIELNYKPFYLTGLTYFRVSLQAVIKIAEFNETKAFLAISSQLNELSAELKRQGKLPNDLVKHHLRSYGRNCAEATEKSKSSGIYEILIPSYSKHPFKVTCDTQTQGGGWTVILSRMDGSVDFYRNWNLYKKGFGDLDGEFFLGLDKIHALTSEYSQELLVVLEDFEGIERSESYEKFAIGDEDELYVLHTLGKATGTADDSLRQHHTMKFSTFDRDNDRSVKNCAEFYTGGWWYNECHHSNLAGKYKDNTHGKGINWYHFRGHLYSLKRAVMMIRPRK
ncbi:hypothetical protein ACLKA7_004563 [Drosophila subpalustris]